MPVARRWESWLTVAIFEEEQELEEIIHPPHGRLRDVLLAAAALVLVVAASVVMERSGTSIGTHFGVPPIVTGGVVLAAVTSLPNAVAAVYLAARGRGAAMLSTTLNSNALNVTAGLLLPATITGLGAPSVHAVLIAVWYLALTAAALAFAFRDGGVRRATGAFIIGSYLVFLGSLLVTAHSANPGPGLTVVPLLVTVLAALAGLARRPGRRGGRDGRVARRRWAGSRAGVPGGLGGWPGRMCRARQPAGTARRPGRVCAVTARQPEGTARRPGRVCAVSRGTTRPPGPARPRTRAARRRPGRPRRAGRTTRRGRPRAAARPATASPA